MNQSPVDPATRTRNRGLLILILAIFFGSMLVAGVLRFSGWQPEGRRNHGELIEPPTDLRAQPPALADGGTYAWQPGERIWRIVVAPGAGCGADCAALARDIDKVWQLLGKDAPRVHLLWACDAPACLPPADVPRPATFHRLRREPALLAALPRHDDPAGVPVYVIDPNGFVILRYAPGHDPGGLRADLVKLLKLI